MITASWHLAFPLLIFLAWGNCRLFVPNIVAGSFLSGHFNVTFDIKVLCFECVALRNVIDKIVIKGKF